MSVEVKAFDVPDDTVTFDHGNIQLVTVGSITIGREVLEPGWRWSEHVKPIVGTEWCEFHRAMYLLSGRVRVLNAWWRDSRHRGRRSRQRRPRA